jgi:hypothetical protein
MTMTSVVSYAACAVLVAVFAWNRFNTPQSNRSSTRQALYWSSCAGYMFTALGLFFALSVLLEISPWRALLFGKDYDQTLSAPLIATVAMTTLLPSVPILKTLDGSILAAFLDWGAIPAELKRRAATMTTGSFIVAAEDVSKLKEAYGDAVYGETLAAHLRDVGTDGIELSEYRLTQVVKLYDRVRGLAGEERYATFFAGAGEQFEEIQRRVEIFARQSAASLTLAVKLRALEGQQVYEELAHERREMFAQNCRGMFNDLALFLAGAVLRSEQTEDAIVDQLRLLGFEGAKPMNEPEFPINSLTLLAFGLFAYLALLTMFFSHLKGVPHPQGDSLLMASKIALTRIVTTGLVVWLMQRFSFFRRNPGDERKYFAYGTCGLIAIIVAAGVCLPFASIDSIGLWAELHDSFPPIVLTGMLCAVLALCCDDWPQDNDPPRWLRFAEATGCAAMMAFGASFLYFGGMLPESMGIFTGWMIVSWIALPSAMAAVIGGVVPHIYRSARRASAARRRERVPGDSEIQNYLPRLADPHASMASAQA